MQKISLAIPYYNNARFMKQTLAYPILDDRIDEIIISDDLSSDKSELQAILNELNSNKIKFINNDKNVGVYANKVRAIKHCKNDWAILFDSDNIFNKEYIDAIYNSVWDKNKILAPALVKQIDDFSIENGKNFDCLELVGEIDKNNFFNFEIQSIVMMVFLNTCNYFVPTKEFVRCAESHMSEYDLSTIASYDSLTLFTDWLCANNRVEVVKDMKYYHRVHSNSTYVKNSYKINLNFWYAYCYAKIKNAIK